LASTSRDFASTSRDFASSSARARASAGAHALQLFLGLHAGFRLGARPRLGFRAQLHFRGRPHLGILLGLRANLGFRLREHSRSSRRPILELRLRGEPRLGEDLRLHLGARLLLESLRRSCSISARMRDSISSLSRAFISFSALRLPPPGA
jgi:hypothetical protein